MYKILDVPQIPEELIYPVEKVLELNNFACAANKNYTIHRCQNDLTEYLKTLFPECEEFCYQTIASDLRLDYGETPVHKDVGRDFAINYVIETGGDDVRTAWYTEKESGEKITEVILPEKTWCKIKVDEWHAVHDLETRRYAITVF